MSLWDAQTDADLSLVAEAGAQLRPPPLWCGSGGLAAAIANAVVPGPPRMDGPLLGLFGSDHPVTAAQLERCADRLVLIGDGEADAGRVAAHLGNTGACLVRCNLPGGLGRAESARQISREFGRLVEPHPKARHPPCFGRRDAALPLRSPGDEPHGRPGPAPPRSSRLADSGWIVGWSAPHFEVGLVRGQRAPAEDPQRATNGRLIESTVL